ncbi:hypothetical protein Bca101_069611 [Brassica carinata]
MEPQVDKQNHLDHKFLMRIIIIIMNDTLVLPQPTGYWPFPFPVENRTQFPAKTDVERAIKYKKKKKLF